MNAQRSVGPSRRLLPSAGRVIAMAAAFALVGYGGLVTFANHSATTMGHAALASPTVAVMGIPGEAATQSNDLANTPSAVDAQNDPRECDTAKGITSNCVFE